MEEYPITIDGEAAGTLRVERNGARTVFSAVCAMREGLVRLSVYGGGREGCLGVLAPEDGMLRLRRELSRNALRDFPEEIEYVERSGAMPEPGLRSAPVPEAEPPDPAEARPGPEPEAPCGGETGPPEEELSWYASPDGALVSFDGSRTLIALPLGDERIPSGVRGEARRVEGRDYMVYHTRSGRIV